MMLEIQEHRKRERDFTSLEDQIRCLQRRFYNLDATEQGEEEALKQGIIEEGLQIDSLREQLGALRFQIQGSKRDNAGFQDKNLRLYHMAGERNAELAQLRGETTKQMTANQEMEVEIERYKQANQRLADESDEIQNTRAKVERQAQDHRQKAGQIQQQIKEHEAVILGHERESRDKEDQTVRLINEISTKRLALDDASRELHNVEGSLSQIRARNKDMRTSQFDQEKRIKILQTNFNELTQTKTLLEGDFDQVKSRLADKEVQIIEIEQTLTREQDRERLNVDRRRELMERIEIMSQKSILLEKHQQEMEKELF